MYNVTLSYSYYFYKLRLEKNGDGCKVLAAKKKCGSKFWSDFRYQKFCF